MSVKSRVIMVFALFLLAACSMVGGDQGASQPTAPPPSDPTALALVAAQAHLENHLGRELEGIQVAYGPGEWTDTSLGCPQDGVAPEEQPITGYTFEMTVDGVMYELHTDGDGSIVVLCPEKRAETAPKEINVTVPAEIENPLELAKTKVAEAAGVPFDEVAIENLVWELTSFPNTGLGCPEPDMAYAEVMTEGYVLMFSFQEQAYEIHTDLAGESAVLCPVEETAEIEPPAEGASTDLPDAIETPFISARLVLAEALGMPAESLSFDAIGWEEATFGSTALGCPEDGMTYAAMEVDGYAFSLIYSGIEYQVHTDLAGANAVICSDGGQDSADEHPRIVFTSYGDDALEFGISYPLGWTIERAEADGEVFFRPAGGDPTLGMTISRLEASATDLEASLSQYRITLYNNDASAIEIEAPQPLEPNGRSQVYSREVAGVTIFERVTFFAEGYRVHQWGPMDERTTWGDPFIQMLTSFVALDADQ